MVNPPHLTLVTSPAAEVWQSTDPEVSSFLRLDSANDAALVSLILRAARRHFERTTGLSLITQTWRCDYDLLPPGAPQYGMGMGFGLAISSTSAFAMLPTAGRELYLGRSPLQAVTSFKYLDSAGVLQTFDPANYTLGNVGDVTNQGRLWLNDGGSWPDFGTFPNALQITLTVGFGASAASVPEEIRMAILWFAAHWYENHLPTGDTDSQIQLPFHLENMIDHWRVSHVA